MCAAVANRRHRLARWLLAALAVAFCGAARGATLTIPLPGDLKVTPPAADVPPNLARFVGAWSGAWDGVLPHVLVVEAVDASGSAQVVYASGDSAEADVARGHRRVTARVVGDVLMCDLSDRALVVYHMDGDFLRGTYTSTRRRSTVRLRRRTLAEVAAMPATVPGAAAGATVRIPTKNAGRGGKPLTLEAVLYRPQAIGPYPVLLFNHGSTGSGTVAVSVTMRPTRVAQFFVEHGFAVLAPMRRGRGTSDGAHEEYEGTCMPDVLGAGLARAVEDVDAAIAYLRTQPWADPARVIVAGQSRGGVLAVVYAAERPGAVRGVVNFAGGWTSQRCDDEGRSFNQPTFARAGRSRVPTLWLYAERDSYYGPSSIRRYHDAFTQAGGVATLHLFRAFDDDGHRLIDRVEIWKRAADEFLRGLNLSHAAP